MGRAAQLGEEWGAGAPSGPGLLLMVMDFLSLKGLCRKAVGHLPHTSGKALRAEGMCHSAHPHGTFRAGNVFIPSAPLPLSLHWGAVASLTSFWKGAPTDQRAGKRERTGWGCRCGVAGPGWLLVR